jgi:hypothetical protein
LAGDLARVLWERTTPADQPWLSSTSQKATPNSLNDWYFSLPAGRTCPGANICKAFVGIDSITGKRSIIDGKDMLFRCFAASSEVQYDAVYVNRKENLDLIVAALQNGTAVDLINASIQENRSKGITLVRIHESGDFFSGAYLDAWLQVALLNPDLKFYCYSKSLQLFYLLKSAHQLLPYC